MYFVKRDKINFEKLFSEQPFKKRDKDFGEFLNTKYNNDELYFQYNELGVRKKNKERKCGYCNRQLNKGGRNFCVGCGCERCGRFDENIKLYFIEKKNKYLCNNCL
jgi:hypothetical protein